jgi:hypothetical protein
MTAERRSDTVRGLPSGFFFRQTTRDLQAAMVSMGLAFLIHSVPAASARENPPPTATTTAATLDIWHGDVQRIGHLGEPQSVFNVMGHIEPWRDLDRLEWSLNDGDPVPLSFRAYRRLAADGDFNADIPRWIVEPWQQRPAGDGRFPNPCPTDAHRQHRPGTRLDTFALPDRVEQSDGSTGGWTIRGWAVAPDQDRTAHRANRL